MQRVVWLNTLRIFLKKHRLARTEGKSFDKHRQICALIAQRVSTPAKCAGVVGLNPCNLFLDQLTQMEGQKID